MGKRCGVCEHRGEFGEQNAKFANRGLFGERMRGTLTGGALGEDGVWYANRGAGFADSPFPLTIAAFNAKHRNIQAT